MPDAVVVILSLQLVLTLGLVIGVFIMMSRVLASLERASELMKQVQETLESDVKPAIHEARAAIARASATMEKAAPLVNTASQLTGKVTSKGGLWLDAAKLALGVFMAVRSRRKSADVEQNKGDNDNGT